MASEKEAARPPAIAAQARQEVGHSPVFDFWTFGIGDLSLFPMLNGQSLLHEMERMAETDDTIGSMMWCFTSTMSQVPFKHVAQVDGRDNDGDPEAVRMAELLDQMMEDMDESFDDHIDVALRMIPMGFSLAEIVLKQRVTGQSRYNDKLWGIKSLPARDPLSILGWQYDDDRRNLVSARQMSPTGSADLPVWKLLHYRTTASMENPWGRPLFKNAWRPWKLKVKMQDIEAVGAERELVGLPTFRMPKETIDTASELDDNGQPTPEALKARAMIRAAQDAVSNLRVNKTGGLILPSDPWADELNGITTPKFDFKLVTTAGQRTIDIRQPIRDYDRAIARVAMMQFLHLGDRSTGSYSLSDDQSSMAVKSMTAIINRIVGEWNKKLIPLLWRVNGFDPRYMPRLGAGDLSKDNLQQIGSFLGGLSRIAGLWETDIDARMSIGKMVGMPLNRKAQGAAVKRVEQASTQQQLDLPFGGNQPQKDPGNDAESGL